MAPSALWAPLDGNSASSGAAARRDGSTNAFTHGSHFGEVGSEKAATTKVAV